MVSYNISNALMSHSCGIESKGQQWIKNSLKHSCNNLDLMKRDRRDSHIGSNVKSQ